jgi:hypothetical protein
VDEERKSEMRGVRGFIYTPLRRPVRLSWRSLAGRSPARAKHVARRREGEVSVDLVGLFWCMETIWYDVRMGSTQDTLLVKYAMLSSEAMLKGALDLGLLDVFYC